MKLEGEHILALPQDEAWRRLDDPRALRASVPGLESLEPRAPDQYDFVLEVRLPALHGRFEGALEYLERQPPASLRLRLRGKGALGFVDGEVALSLGTTEAGTRAAYAADVQIGGQVSRLGQRMISGVTREMAAQFFSSLERWDPANPDAKVAPSPGRAALQLAGRTVLRGLGLGKDKP